MGKNEDLLALVADYQSTFKTAHGKRVLKDLLKKAGFIDTNYVPGDSHGTAFNEGGRNLVLHIVRNLKMNVNTISKQLLEVDTDED